MNDHKWKSALKVWHHLHQRKLVRGELYAHVANCFFELEQSGDAIQILEATINAYQDIGSWQLFECLAMIAEKGESEASEGVATDAYELATRRFLTQESNLPYETR